MANFDVNKWIEGFPDIDFWETLPDGSDTSIWVEGFPNIDFYEVVADGVTTNSSTIDGYSVIQQVNSNDITGYSVILNPNTDTVTGYSVVLNTNSDTITGYSTVSVTNSTTISGYSVIKKVRSTADAPSNLEAYWKLDGDATDELTNYDLTNNNVTYVSGKFGSAGSFTASPDLSRLSAAGSIGAVGSNDFTLSAWVNTNNPTQVSTIAVYHGNDSGGYGFGIGTGTGGTGSEIMGLYGGITWINLDYEISADTWYHVTMTRDGVGSRVKFYINNEDQGTLTNATPNNTQDAFEIGHEPAAGGRYYDGLIDDVRIYSLGVTQVEAFEISTANPGDVSGYSVVVEATVTNSDTITGYSVVKVIASDDITGFSTVLRTETDTITGYAVVQEEDENAITGYSVVLRTESDTIDGYSVVLATASDTVTGYSVVTASGEDTISGYSVIFNTESDTIEGYSKVCRIAPPSLVSPSDLATDTSPVEFVWLFPETNLVGSMYFRVTVGSDDSVTTYENYTYSAPVGSFEYEHPTSNWNAYPSTGLDPEFLGSQVRLTSALDTGSYTWVVRGGIT